MDYKVDPGTDQEDLERHNYYNINMDSNLPRAPSRRTKRLVPETEKDTRYWEKRKRNNDAAKRSRENKRRMDTDLRQRIIIVEEEVNLLKKELTVIKNKYGLPLHQKFFSVDQNGELIASPAPPPLVSSYLDSRNSGSGSSSGSGHSRGNGEESHSSGHNSSSDNSLGGALRGAVHNHQSEVINTMPVKKRRWSYYENQESNSPPPAMSVSLQERVAASEPYYNPSAYPPHMMWTGNYAPGPQYPSGPRHDEAGHCQAPNHHMLTPVSMEVHEQIRPSMLPPGDVIMQDNRDQQRAPLPPPPPPPPPPQHAENGYQAANNGVHNGHPLINNTNMYQQQYPNPTLSVPNPRRGYYVEYNKSHETAIPADLSVANRDRQGESNSKNNQVQGTDLEMLESAESLLSMNSQEYHKKNDERSLSSGSEESLELSTDQEEAMERENQEIRKELQALTAEVAKMKNCMKDDKEITNAM